ncbi:MAG: cell wall hydrolase [Sphingomicrobium sp.]
MITPRSSDGRPHGFEFELKKFLGVGSMSAFAAAALLTLGGPDAAIAQQVTAGFPVVQAVVRTATSPIDAIARIVTPAPAAAIPLATLVDTHSAGGVLDEQGKCLATAVYFESMGEPLEGQLAVAQVVINRARSGRYPASWCGVVKQKAQFSFVRAGRFPRISINSEAWGKAQAIARIAALNITAALPADVLWYHADYVAPSWGRRLTRAEKIGAHIFYRS